jgi:hypothetical protein
MMDGSRPKLKGKKQDVSSSSYSYCFPLFLFAVRLSLGN